MLKLFNKLLILVVISISKYTLALSSSSYLIANTAVNLFDFEEANIRMDFSYEYMSENDLFEYILADLYQLAYIDRYQYYGWKAQVSGLMAFDFRGHDENSEMQKQMMQ